MVYFPGLLTIGVPPWVPDFAIASVWPNIAKPMLKSLAVEAFLAASRSFSSAGFEASLPGDYFPPPGRSLIENVSVSNRLTCIRDIFDFFGFV